MKYNQADIRNLLLFSVEDCYEAGRAEGLAAGSAEMRPLQRDFGPAEEQLALGHFLLDGAYVEVRADRADFESEAHMLAWTQGLYQGVAEANALVGFSTAVDENNGRGRQHYFFVQCLRRAARSSIKTSIWSVLRRSLSALRRPLW